MTDRRVHAANHQAEVVRYDKAGKWYIEPLDKTLPRQQVSVADAARYALWLYENGGVVKQGIPGGTAFDNFILVRDSEGDPSGS